MVNPPKTRSQVDKEFDDGKNLYKISHHRYDVGKK